MTPDLIRRKVVIERSDWVREMFDRIRALEAMLDLGRHMLAKGFGDAPAEYRQVAVQLGAREVLTSEEAALLAKMAGYRNRMVHFYDRVSEAELYELCTDQLGDLEEVLGGVHRWLHDHPDQVDSSV